MDFGRMERQQRFLTAVREQAMGWDLPFKLPGLISALFQNIATDLDANEILRLAKWGISLSGDSIRGITLRGSTPTINGASYVVATEDQMASAVTQLLYRTAPEDTVDTTDSTEGAEGVGSTDTTSSNGAEEESTTTTVPADVAGISLDIDGATGRIGEAGAAAMWLRSLGATVVTSADNAATAGQRSAVQYPTGMLADAKRVAAATGIAKVARTSKVDRVTVVMGEDFVLPAAFALAPGPDSVPDAAVWKQWAGLTPFAVEAPEYLPERYSFVLRYPDAAATYNIKTGGGEKPAFRMLYAAEGNSDQVLGITETAWLDAPAASKGLEVTHDGVVFTVVRNDTKVERVWWKRDGVLYFVSNTLSHWLDQDEMLKIAESMIAIPAQ
jgi:hypothetical protein